MMKHPKFFCFRHTWARCIPSCATRSDPYQGLQHVCLLVRVLVPATLPTRRPWKPHFCSAHHTPCPLSVLPASFSPYFPYTRHRIRAPLLRCKQKREIESLKGRISKAEPELYHLNEELTRKREETKRLYEKLTRLHEEMGRRETHHTRQTMQIQSASDELVAKLQQQCDEAEAMQQQQSQEATANLETQRAESERKLKELEAQNERQVADFQAKYEEKEREVAMIIRTHEEEREKWEQTISNVEVGMKRELQEILHLKDENVRLKSDLQAKSHQVSTYACMLACIYIYLYIYTHTHTHTHTYTYTYTYTYAYYLCLLPIRIYVHIYIL